MLAVTPLDTLATVAGPDLVWDGTRGDIARQTDGTDLRGAHPIATAIMLSLFTDARCEEFQARPEHGRDRRGWPGDGIALDGEPAAPLGSVLWLYRRSALLDATAREVEDAIRAALQPLVAEGAIGAIDITVAVDKAQGRLVAAIDVAAPSGARLFKETLALPGQNRDRHPLAP